MKILLSLSVPLAFLLMWLIEARWPARAYVPVRRWKLTGALFFLAVIGIASLTPLFWNWAGLTSLQVFDLAELGLWGYPLGLLLSSFLGYWWHRAEHRFDPLWRAAHQLHHSALRVDIPGAFYSHPLEVLVKSTLGILVSVVLLGLAPLAAVLVSLTLALLALFQHWNIHTPRWLGWVVPRPEMHAAHHEYQVHGRNYGDLPLWDLLFGTFHNPPRFEGRVGFDAPASARLGDMLLMRDVNQVPAAPVQMPRLQP